MRLKLSNLNEPDNRIWKKVADYFIYTLPLYSSAIAVGASILWSDKIALILTIVINCIVISLKGLTKFTSDSTVTSNE